MKTRVIGAVVAVTLGLVGTLVLVTYVRGADARALADTRTVNILVVSDQIAEGTPAEELDELVASEAVPAKVVAANSVASLDQIEGQVATTDLEPGEQLITARFADPEALEDRGQVEIPEGMQQVTVALDPQRALGGQLLAGDTVGVFVSMSEGSDAGPTTHLVLHKVLVTAVQGGPEIDTDADDDEEAVDPMSTAVPERSLLVTFAADAPDAERLVFAAEHGTVWLSAEPADADEAGTRIQTKEEIYR